MCGATRSRVFCPGRFTASTPDAGHECFHVVHVVLEDLRHEAPCSQFAPESTLILPEVSLLSFEIVKSILFTADRRVIVKPANGPAREATDEDRAEMSRTVWPFWWHIRMPPRDDSPDG